MANLKKSRTSIVEGILGHNAAPRNVVLRGMAGLEKTLERRLREVHRERMELSRANARLRDRLFGAQLRDVASEAAIREQRALVKKLRSRRVAPPQIPRKKERVFVGSIGGSRVPPFDYPWTWSATAGSPSVATSADVNAGQMNVREYSDVNNGSSASARAALGIFFTPPTEGTSHFRFWANPAFNYFWDDYCTLDSAHSDGFIGLYAGEYDWSGAQTSVPVDQMLWLWSDDSWWFGASGQGSNTGFPLSADFEVDNDHWYALWVWCGIDNSAAGLGGFFGSMSNGGLSVTVPSISWELG
jgi:hypothetical protein